MLRLVCQSMNLTEKVLILKVNLHTNSALSLFSFWLFKPTNWFGTIGSKISFSCLKKFTFDFADLKTKLINTQKISTTSESAEVPSSSTESTASCSSSSRADEPKQKQSTKNADSTTDEPKSSDEKTDSNTDADADTNPDINANSNANANTNEDATGSASTSASANENVDVDTETDTDKEEAVEKALDDEAACGSSTAKPEEAESSESDDQKVDLADSTSKLSCIEENSAGDDTLIDVEDPDDYLLYLESILMKIHSRFYTHYGETEQVTFIYIFDN